MNKKSVLSRRQFFVRAGVGVGFPLMLGAAPRAVAASAFGTGNTVRLGLIGFGNRGRELAREMERIPGARLVAVSDIFAPHKTLANSVTGARVHHDWRDLVVAADVDGVLVAAPDHWHAPMAIAAMEAGKDVYCESPMALRAEDAKAFRDCAARTGRIVQIGIGDICPLPWQQARAIIESGALGRLVWGQGSYERNPAGRRKPVTGPVNERTLDWPAFDGADSRRPFDGARFASWRHYWDYSGGVVTEALYGKLAALLVAVGAEFPSKVSAAGGVYARDGREVPDSFVMSAEYPGGHTLVLASSMASSRTVPAIIRGEKASLEFCRGFLRVLPETGAPAREERIPVTGRERSPLDEWIEAIRGRRRCTYNEDVGYKTTVAIAMAIEAYRRERTVFFDAGTMGRMGRMGRMGAC